ncbi:hypothetical protein BT96DRAFT_763967, partial [Gymnopus androsaceus JB14]
HFFTHIPQPIHRTSDMKEILSVGLTSIHNLPDRLRSNEKLHYQKDFRPTISKFLTFLHSWAHLFGLQRLASTIAIRVILSAMILGRRG